jgi:hypothetical protein
LFPFVELWVVAVIEHTEKKQAKVQIVSQGGVIYFDIAIGSM